MKYLYIFDTFTSGTYMGRDDGYPCKGYRVYNSIEELAEDYGPDYSGEYYELKLVDPHVLYQEVQAILVTKEKVEKEKERKRKEEEFERLRIELGK